MNFDLTDEQRMIRDTARDFAAREIAPKASEIDKGKLPKQAASDSLKRDSMRVISFWCMLKEVSMRKFRLPSACWCNAKRRNGKCRRACDNSTLLTH